MKTVNFNDMYSQFHHIVESASFHVGPILAMSIWAIVLCVTLSICKKNEDFILLSVPIMIALFVGFVGYRFYVEKQHSYIVSKEALAKECTIIAPQLREFHVKNFSRNQLSSYMKVKRLYEDNCKN